MSSSGTGSHAGLTTGGAVALGIGGCIIAVLLASLFIWFYPCVGLARWTSVFKRSSTPTDQDSLPTHSKSPAWTATGPVDALVSHGRHSPRKPSNGTTDTTATHDSDALSVDSAYPETKLWLSRWLGSGWSDSNHKTGRDVRPSISGPLAYPPREAASHHQRSGASETWASKLMRSIGPLLNLHQEGNYNTETPASSPAKQPVLARVFTFTTQQQPQGRTFAPLVIGPPLLNMQDRERIERRYKSIRSVTYPNPTLDPIERSPPLTDLIKLRPFVKTPSTSTTHTPSASFAQQQAKPTATTTEQSPVPLTVMSSNNNLQYLPRPYSFIEPDSPIQVPAPLRIPQKQRRTRTFRAPTSNPPSMPPTPPPPMPVVAGPILSRLDTKTAINSHPTTPRDDFTANDRLSPFSPLRSSVYAPGSLSSTSWPSPISIENGLIGIALGSPVIHEVSAAEEGEQEEAEAGAVQRGRPAYGRSRVRNGSRGSQASVFRRHPGDRILSP